MKRVLYLFLFLLGISVAGNAQNTNSSIIGTLSRVTKFGSLYPQEKAYLHFDNTAYFKGETIWYKAYVVQTMSEVRSGELGVRSGYKPTGLSKVLYVELVSPGGDVLETQKLHIDENGGAHGQFELDSILGSGFYEVRAYTRYMVNWGVNAIFSRVFPIFEATPAYGDYSAPTIKTTLYKDRNPNSRMADSLYLTAAKEGLFTNDKPNKISATFYPEGGDLVMGLKSRVAVSVIDDNGSAYKGKGEIVDGGGKVVCSVETDSTGRGLFELVPTGEKLFLSMPNHRKKVQKIELPVVKSEGVTMYLDVVDDDMSVVLRSQGDIIGSDIGYALMHDGTIFACDTMKAQSLIELSLDRYTMPEGVNQITVFGAGGKILSERLFFICPKPDKSDSIIITPASKGLGPVSEVILDLKTRPNSVFSFSAMDWGTMKNGRQGNAKTWMLLSSDVKGYIANIDYYFEADDKEHRQAADLLMMVQGWRRYDWQLMSGQKWFNKTHPIEDQLYIYGQLREYRKKNPVSHVEMDTYLFNRQGQSLMGSTTTDSLGNYALKLPDVNGDWALQIFTKINDKRKTFYVGIDRQFAPFPRFITPDETKVTQRNRANLFGKDDGRVSIDEKADELNYAERVKVIPEVTIKARKYFTSDDNIQWYSQRTGRHWATVYYNGPQELDKVLDRGERMPSVFEFLAIRNPLFGNPDYDNLPSCLEVSLDSLKPEVWLHGMAYGGRKIRWIIDNGLATYVSDQSHFEKLSGQNSFDDIVTFPQWMDEVKAIYIVPWSPKEEESYVRIYIYRQQIFTTESQKGLRRTHYQGYNVPETYRMEDLNVLPPLENLRRTLYWEPDVKADENGEARIVFYNNLSAKQIFVTAEGLSPDGRILVNE